MERIKSRLTTLGERKTSKHKYFWQSQAEEVSLYFGKPLYWLFHRFLPEEIMSQYQYMKETDNKNVGQLISHLQWNKKNGQGKTTGND